MKKLTEKITQFIENFKNDPMRKPAKSVLTGNQDAPALERSLCRP